MGKPVGSRFGQIVSKIQDWSISSRNRVYHLYKTVSFSEKRPRRRETGFKDDFEETEHEFPLENSVQKNRTTFSDIPLLPEIFHWSDPESRVPFTLQPDSPEAFCKR